MMTDDELGNMVSQTLKSSYFEIIENKRSIKLSEKNNDGNKNTKSYSFIIELTEDLRKQKFLILKNLEELKNYAHYLKSEPKDCDYVILNESLKLVIFIELKNTNCRKEEIIEQLYSGKKWAEHLLFCSGYGSSELKDSIFDGWQTHYICLNYKRGRRVVQRGSSQNQHVYRNMSANFLKGNRFQFNNLLK